MTGREVNPIGRLAESIRYVATSWPEFKPPYHEKEYVNPYSIATRCLISAARARLDPPLPEPLASSEGLVHGAKVIGYYAEIAAVIAQKQGGWTARSLHAALDTDTSFQSLATIASQPNNVAVGVEDIIGLREYSHFPDDPTVLRRYSLDPSNFSAKDVDAIVLIERMKKGLPPKTSGQATEKCPAHRIGNLRKIYSAILQICANDPELFETTLKSE